MDISFRLNGSDVSVKDEGPTRTLLDWLREKRGLTGTKEGCNEGDCGACTVMVTDHEGAKALNACILFLPQLHGKAVRTVEGIAAPCGALHPVQQTLIEHHGSQCGFCTPGFVVSMATDHLNGSTDHDATLAGNLCRCTGYAPIVRAAQAAQTAPIPDHMRDTPPSIGPECSEGSAGSAPKSVRSTAGAELSATPGPALPASSDELAAWALKNPQGTIIAGATDVGLWVTKQFRELGEVAFLHGCHDLQQIAETESEIRLGAGVTITRAMAALPYAQLHGMFRRYGSHQVRNAATLGGNIANGSPIGDSPPPLIALGATLHLRKGDTRRSLPLEEFFIAYGKQDRAPGEFVEAITVPKRPDILRVYKLSKRFDQDISAVCGSFYIPVEAGRIRAPRIAFGGLAGTPARARQTEAALEGRPWSHETVERAAKALAADYTPLSDMRASAEYRLKTAQNMLRRAFLEDGADVLDVRGVRP
ncbi:MAG: xanthine dehydrogenase small subunit [Pseudomonadota bacterium]